MKKIISMFLLLILAVTLVSAADFQNIKEALDNIDNNFKSADNLDIVIGANSADAPAYIAMMPIFQDNIQDYGIGAGIMKIDSENIDITNRDLIIAGGPCANKFWAEFSDETCDNWPYNAGQSLVKAVPNGEYTALLVAGTTKEDTMEIAQKLADYKSLDILNSGLEVVYTSKADRTKERAQPCKENTRDYVCAYLHDPVRYTIKIKDITYHITVEKIDISTDSIDLDIDGTKHSNVELGQSIELKDNVELILDHFHVLGDAVEIYFSEPFDWGSFGPKEISKSKGRAACTEAKVNQETAWVRDAGIVYVTNLRTDLDTGVTDLKINGEIYRNLNVGDTIDLDIGEKFKFEEIDENINQPRFCFE